MKRYSVYLTAWIDNKIQKLKLSVTASTITIASERAIAKAKASLNAHWEVSMIWYDFPQEAL